MDTSLLDSQKVSATVAAIDGAGAPSVLPSGVVPAWTSGSPSVFTVDASADPTGMSATVTAVVVGTGVLTVSAALDANTTITGTANVTVTASAAGSLVISFGTPVSK